METGLYSSTRYGTQGHYHIFYLKQDGTGYSSKNAGHNHICKFIPTQQPEVDPQTGQPSGQAIPEHWAIEPVSSSGTSTHIHELRNIDLPEKDSKETDSDLEIVQTVRSKYKKAYEHERESIMNGKESKEMKKGNLWDDDIRNKLQKDDRAIIEINEAKAKLDALSGYQRRNRLDPFIRPMENGDDYVSMIYNGCINRVLNNTDYLFQESLAFEDAMDVGRGLIQLEIDQDDDIKGKIKLTRCEWDDVVFGPHNSLDLSDCEFLVKSKWVSLDKLKEIAPDKAEEITTEYLTAMQETKSSGYPDDNYQHPDNRSDTTDQLMQDSDFVNINDKKYRMMELQQKTLEPVEIFSNTEDDFFLPVEISKYMKKEDLDSLRALKGFEVIKKRRRKLKITVIAGTTVVSSKFSPLDEFTVFPIYANKEKDFFWGKMHEVKGAIREYIKRHSQIADWGNREAGSNPWVYSSDTFENEKDEKNFLKNAGKAGAIIKVRDMQHQPEWKHNQTSAAELIRAEELLGSKVGQLLNVNDSLIGAAGANESGTVFQARQLAALMGNEYMFDNLSLMKRNLTKMIMKSIRILWEPEDILDMLGLLNQDKFDQINVQYLVTKLKEAKDEYYRVVIDESKSSPTRRLANLQIMMELFRSAPGSVSIALIASLMDLPPDLKSQWMQELQQSQQAAAQDQQQSSNSEIEKTKIAAQPRVMAIQLQQQKMQMEMGMRSQVRQAINGNQ